MEQLRRRAARRSQGFTLIELMITLAVLGIGLLSLAVLQVQALKDGSRAKHRTAASMIVQDQIERIQATAFTDPAVDVMSPVAWTRVPWLTATGTNGEVPIVVTQTGGDITEIVFTAWYRVMADPIDPSEDEIRRVDLEVVWQEDGVSNNQPTRTGQPTVAVSTVLVDNDK